MQYSESEFETLYTQYFPTSMRLAMSLLHDENEARDVVQEVFLRLWESKTKVVNPPAFLIRAVRNASLNRISMMDTRDKIRQRIILESPPDDFDVEECGKEIKSAILLLLTSREQEVIEQIYTKGMSYKETAENLDVSVATVNKNIVSALRKLRNHFKTRKS